LSHFAQLPRHVTPDAVPDFSPTHERFNVVWRDGQVCNLPPTVGPNGGPVGYNSSGDKVEYLFNDDMEDSLFLEENILRRNDRAILEAYDELWYRVWGLRRECLGGAPAPSREPPPSGESAATGAPDSDVAYGMLVGRLAALAWVLGMQWEEASDT